MALAILNQNLMSLKVMNEKILHIKKHWFKGAEAVLLATHSRTV